MTFQRRSQGIRRLRPRGLGSAWRVILIASALAWAASLSADDKPPNLGTIRSNVSSENPFTFRFQFDPNVPYYYVVENDLRESGGVPPLLSYSTTLRDRKTIVQRCNHPTSQPIAMPGSSLVSLTWEVDRYEARERGMKEESFFDSLRHLYPPPSLRELGTVPGARSTFLVDPTTGQSSNLSTTPGVAGDAAPRRGLMGKTAEKCMWNISTVKRLLDDLGPFYFPDGPKKIGDEWSRTFTDMPGPYGALTTRLTCTFRDVKNVDGRQVAVIDLNGDIVLQPPAVPKTTSAPTSMPTTQPGTTAPALPQPPPSTRKSHEFKLDKAICKGTVEFDLTHGELMSLNLQRESSLAADIESPQMGKMQLRTAFAHLLKIKGSRIAPPKPVIVGGKVPPKIPDSDKEAAEIFGAPRVTATQPVKRRHAPAATAVPQPGNPAVNSAGANAPRPNKSRVPGNGATPKYRPPVPPTTQPSGSNPTSQSVHPRD